jgi:hypothetical protein
MIKPVASAPDQWVVTCADDRAYEELLVPFLGSLFSLAKWQGRVAVLDYGLSPKRVACLRRFGVEVETIPRLTFVNLDRFMHLGDFCRRHPGIISHWDADMWFCGGMGELFNHFERQFGQSLVCCLDRVFQRSCYGVAADAQALRELKKILRGVRRKHGNILQCAFLCGTSSVFAEFCDYLRKWILRQEGEPVWNSDTVALNFYYHEHPDRVRIVPPIYNCLPDWWPELRGKRFFLEDRRVRVMHVSSPYRVDGSGTSFRFQTLHPRLHKRWLAALST